MEHFNLILKLLIPLQPLKIIHLNLIPYSQFPKSCYETIQPDFIMEFIQNRSQMTASKK